MLRRWLTKLPIRFGNSPNDSDGVSIRRGVIRVRDAGLFRDLRGSECVDFCQRVFRCDQVQAVEIDTRDRVATIRAGHGVSTTQLLEQLATMLQAADPPTCPAIRALLEQQQGDRVSIRRDANVFSTWQVARAWPGALLLKHADASTWAVARRISARLEDVSGIQDIRWRSVSHRLMLRYDPNVIDRSELLARLDAAMLWADVESEPESDYGAALSVSGFRRLLYLSLAGVSFGLAGLGVIVPGLPTVPFLLLTSYYLVRSSPQLNSQLLRSRTFGPMIRDWHKHRAMRPRVKAFSIGTMILVVTLTVIFGGLSLPLMVVVLILMTVGMAMILRIPTIRDDAPNSLRRKVPAASSLVLSG